MVAAISILIVTYDLVAMHGLGPDATISRVMRRLFDRVPILYPLFWLWVGILIGHIGLPAE
jgi:hypothetical protein